MNKEIEKKNENDIFKEKLIDLFRGMGSLVIASICLALIIVLVEQLFNIDILNFLKDSLKEFLIL